jgi:hypothetical protein
LGSDYDSSTIELQAQSTTDSESIIYQQILQFLMAENSGNQGFNAGSWAVMSWCLV